MNKIINSLSSGKALDPDSILLKLIQPSANVINNHLANIINKDIYKVMRDLCRKNLTPFVNSFHSEFINKTDLKLEEIYRLKQVCKSSPYGCL